MRSHLILAMLALSAYLSPCRAESVYLTLLSEVHDGVPTGYGAGISINPYIYNGFYGSTRLVSPGGVAGDWTEDLYGGWYARASTPQQAA
ncbi:MAG: hypothetical protein K2Q20_06635, partial [Phycisphaerales bacterium]|nr:hypothetical protein [Phycisphaerales bacterium]